MTDLITRLRADAARTTVIDPPSLDDLLDAVLGVEAESAPDFAIVATPSAPTRRRRRIAPFAAAAAAVVVASAAVAVAAWRGTGGAAGPAGAGGPHSQATPVLVYPPGIARSRGGAPLVRVAGVGVQGVVYDRARPRTLGVLIASDPHGDGCTIYDPTVGVVERADRIVVEVSGWRYMITKQPGTRAGAAPTCVVKGVARHNVVLAAPLGQRRVYNGSQQLPVRLGSATRVTEKAATVVARGQRLQVRLVPRRSELVAGPVIAHATVHNDFDSQPATATIVGTSTRTCLSYPTRGAYFEICGSNASGATTEELVEAAEHLG